MARYKPPRKPRRSSRRNPLRVRRNAEVEASTFFSSLAEKAPVVTESKEQGADRYKRASALREAVREERTGKAREQRRMRESAQMAAGRAQASFDIEQDPVRLTDNYVDVRGNVVEGVAYVLTLPMLRQQIWKYLSLTDLLSYGFKAKSSQVNIPSGMTRREYQYHLADGYDPTKNDPNEFNRRLTEMLAQERGASEEREDQIWDDVVEEMTTEYIARLEGHENEGRLDEDFFMRAAKRAISGGYVDISLVTPTGTRSQAYIAKIDVSGVREWDSPKLTGKAKGELVALNKYLTEIAVESGLIEPGGKVSIVVPQEQRSRFMGSTEKRKQYPLATYSLVNGRLVGRGPLYLRLESPNRTGSIIVTLRYRASMKRRSDLISLYPEGDPRAMNPYYSLVSGGFRQAYDPGVYDNNENFLPASSDTMKEFAAVKDVVKSVERYVNSARQLRGYFVDWTSLNQFSRRRGKTLEFPQADCFMLLNLDNSTDSGGKTAERKTRAIRGHQQKALRQMPTVMQNIVGLYFTMRNIVSGANVKAGKGMPARDFRVFRDADGPFERFQGDLDTMGNSVAFLLGRGTSQSSVATLSSLPALKPMQMMLETAEQTARADEAIENLTDALNAAPSGSEQERLLSAQLAKLKAARKAIRAAARTKGAGRQALEEAARLEAARAAGLDRMSPYQYRRYLATESARQVITEYRELFRPIGKQRYADRVGEYVAVLGLDMQSLDVRNDKILTMLFLWNLLQTRDFVKACQNTLLAAIQSIHATDQAMKAKWQGSKQEWASLEKSYAEHLDMRRGTATFRPDAADPPGVQRFTAADLMFNTLRVPFTETSRERQGTLLFSKEYPNFTSVVDYVRQSEVCLDELMRDKVLRGSYLTRAPYDDRMFALLAFCVNMDIFSPYVTNYLATPKPGGEKIVNQLVEMQEYMQTAMKLPDYRKMGQQMRERYGEEVYYTYNPVLYAYLQKRGSAAARLPRSLVQESEAFGVYGNFIKLLRAAANEIRVQGALVDMDTIAMVYNGLWDSFRYPGVPKLGRDASGEDLKALNQNLKAKASGALSLAGRMTATAGEVFAPSGIATYGRGLGMDGGQATKLQADLFGRKSQRERKDAFLRAVAVYARAIIPAKLYGEATMMTPAEAKTQKAKADELNAKLAKVERALASLPTAQRLVKQREAQGLIAKIKAQDSTILPERVFDALIKTVNTYLTATRGGDKAVDWLPSALRLTVLAAWGSGDLDDDTVTLMIAVLDGLAYVYMRTTAFTPLSPVRVGAASLSDTSGPVVQQASAQYAQYAKALRDINNHVGNYILKQGEK